MPANLTLSPLSLAGRRGQAGPSRAARSHGGYLTFSPRVHCGLNVLRCFSPEIKMSPVPLVWWGPRTTWSSVPCRVLEGPEEHVAPLGSQARRYCQRLFGGLCCKGSVGAGAGSSNLTAFFLLLLAGHFGRRWTPRPSWRESKYETGTSRRIDRKILQVITFLGQGTCVCSTKSNES